MISNEMLAAAAGEVSAAMVECLPDHAHSFSPAFERKLRVLVRRATHPVRRQVLRYCAAVLACAITVFGFLYLFSPTVRAEVSGWIRSIVGSYFQYHTEDTTPPAVEYDYFLPDAFDGYSLYSVLEGVSDNAFIYTNADGQMLSFNYVRGTGGTALFLWDVENHIYSTGFVGSQKADIYISPDNSAASNIVWHDPNENVLFCISAFADKDELIRYAEKVEKTEKN